MATVEKTLRGTVSRRIFLLFVICALIPISAHSLFSYLQVRRQLIDQSRQKLTDQNKHISTSLMERLILLNDDMSVFAGRLRILPPAAIKESLVDIAGAVSSRFMVLSCFSGPPYPAILPEDAEMHLRSGKAVLTCRSEGTTVTIHLYVALDASDPHGGLLRGEVNPSFLWHPVLARPAGVETAVLDSRGYTLFTSAIGPVPFESHILDGFTETHAGHFSYRISDREYLASHRLIYLQPQFYSPPWVMTISEPMSSVLAPAAEFQRFFPMILLLTLATIVVLSLVRIRQTLTPVLQLQEGTRKIAEGDFEYQVEIHSGDEFEVLGDSFNRMSLQLKENERMLLQAERLSTIGRMATGMVHEIKQPITAISGYLELALLGTVPPETRGRLEKVNGAVQRLFSLVDKYRMFSRQPESVLEETSLAEVAVQVHDLFEHQFKVRQISCHLENQPDLPVIIGDSSELQQVVTNLLTNAMDAIDDVEGGAREIEMRTSASNGSASLRISDTGCGISLEDRERIFEPFFTTKSAEKGTGLGMAVIRTILTRHAADIEVDSEPGKGTSFTVTFPAMTA